MNPLSGLYGAGMALRNALFDRGILPALRLERPVVSVGNLSTGGTGKTPFVIALGELLKERGISFDVLSRGYGRKTRGVLVVDPNGSASDFGDEPLLIARKLGVPVVVGESRYEAGRVRRAEIFDRRLHLLDDGFQHRSLARDFDIVLMAAGDFEDRLLPIGRLREPLSSLRRADAIVIPQDSSRPSHIPKAWQMRGIGVKRIHGRFALRSEWRSPGSHRIVFCGIARPQQFFAQVRAAGVTPGGGGHFSRSSCVRRRDIQRLAAMRDELGRRRFPDYREGC